MNAAKSSPERCVICLDEKNSPVSIQCGHSFCCGCLNIYKSYKKFAWATKCPICRNVIREKKKATKRKYSDRNSNSSAGRNTSMPEGQTNSSQSQAQSVNVQETNILEQFMALAANYVDDGTEENEDDSSHYYEALDDAESDLTQGNETLYEEEYERVTDPDVSDSYEEELSSSTDSDEDDDDQYYNDEHNNYYYFDDDDVSYQSTLNRSDTDSYYYDSEQETSFVSNNGDGVDYGVDNLDMDWEAVIASDVIIID